MFTQTSAATVAKSRTAALPVSVRKNCRSGVSSDLAHAVVPENSETGDRDSVMPGFSRMPRRRRDRAAAAQHGHREGGDRHQDHGDSDQEKRAATITLSSLETGWQAAESPDQHAHGQYGGAYRGRSLDHRGTQGPERECGPGPGQLGSLPREPGIQVVHLLGGILGQGHRSTADSRTTTAATAAITVIETARRPGRREWGSGCPRCSARWFRPHSTQPTTDRRAPRTISGTPSARRPHGTPGNGGSSWATASPATTRASAVRLQARKVRSLAKVNRASGSVSLLDGAASSLSVLFPPPLVAVSRQRS